MGAGIGAADGRYGGPAGHDELVALALVVGGVGLGQHHVLHVKPSARDNVNRAFVLRVKLKLHRFCVPAKTNNKNPKIKFFFAKFLTSAQNFMAHFSRKFDFPNVNRPIIYVYGRKEKGR